MPAQETATVKATITCKGKCTQARADGVRVRGAWHERSPAQPAWTRHIFLRVDLVPNGKALIYACTSCGAERRYGLLRLGEAVEADD